MDQQAFAIYVNERYSPELSRHQTQMRRIRRLSRALLIGEVGGLIAVPVLLLLRHDQTGLHPWAMAVCAVVLACALARRVFHCDKRYVQEEQTVDLLREERELYNSRANGYAQEADPHRLFIHRVELHLSRSVPRRAVGATNAENNNSSAGDAQATT